MILNILYYRKSRGDMCSIIYIKSTDNTNIEFNKHSLCNVSEWFEDTIANMVETDISIIDEKGPSLSEDCLKAFKKLCEITHHSSSVQQNNNFKLHKIIKSALPAIEKWDCPGLLRLWFNDINSSCNCKGFYGYNYKYSMYDIIKYESLVLDTEVQWEQETLLFILNECRLSKDKEKKISELKPSTMYKIIVYMNYSIPLDSEKIIKHIGTKNEVPIIMGINRFVKTD